VQSNLCASVSHNDGLLAVSLWLLLLNSHKRVRFCVYRKREVNIMDYSGMYCWKNEISKLIWKEGTWEQYSCFYRAIVSERTEIQTIRMFMLPWVKKHTNTCVGHFSIIENSNSCMRQTTYLFSGLPMVALRVLDVASSYENVMFTAYLSRAIL
jgi:hypothetical protein